MLAVLNGLMMVFTGVLKARVRISLCRMSVITHRIEDPDLPSRALLGNGARVWVGVSGPGAGVDAPVGVHEVIAGGTGGRAFGDLSIQSHQRMAPSRGRSFWESYGLLEILQMRRICGYLERGGVTSTPPALSSLKQDKKSTEWGPGRGRLWRTQLGERTKRKKDGKIDPIDGVEEVSF